MKRYLAACIGLLLSFSVNSADWTPAFDYLKNESSMDGKTLRMIRENVYITDLIREDGKFKKDILTINAKTGNFNIPQPLKSDILPAKMTVSNSKQVMTKIPLKNASLYGYKLQSLNYGFGCSECGDEIFYAEFAPMSDKQFLELKKKVKFAYIESVCGDSPSAIITKDKNKVILNLIIGC